MRKKIEIIDDRNNDRVIGVLRDERGQIENINFFQGDFSLDTIDGMMEGLLKGKNNMHILAIHESVVGMEKHSNADAAIIEAVERYCFAFIYVEI